MRRRTFRPPATRRTFQPTFTFREVAAELTASTIVLPTFYVHIWRPSEYPILDVRVWRVICREQGRSVSRYTKPRSWTHYEAYRQFFWDTVARTKLDWRVVDRGLWVLGGDVEPDAMQDGVDRPAAAGSVVTADKPPTARGERPPIDDDSLDRVCGLVSQTFEPLPFRHRGIRITRELIEAATAELNAAPGRVLPHNCRQLKREDTPDGLDRRIKDRLQTDLRTANIISDVLEEIGVVEVTLVRNPRTGRLVNATRLNQAWSW